MPCYVRCLARRQLTSSAALRSISHMSHLIAFHPTSFTPFSRFAHARLQGSPWPAGDPNPPPPSSLHLSTPQGSVPPSLPRAGYYYDYDFIHTIPRHRHDGHLLGQAAHQARTWFPSPFPWSTIRVTRSDAAMPCHAVPCCAVAWACCPAIATSAPRLVMGVADEQAGGQAKERAPCRCDRVRKGEGAW